MTANIQNVIAVQLGIQGHFGRRPSTKQTVWTLGSRLRRNVSSNRAAVLELLSELSILKGTTAILSLFNWGD